MAQALYKFDDDQEDDVGGFVLYDDKNEYRRQIERLDKLLVTRTHETGVLITEGIKADILTDLQRLLILGNENGRYQFGEPKDPSEIEMSCIDRMILGGRGREVVAWIQDVDWKRRACKQTPILYALARCARSEDPHTKNAAYEILPDVCRNPKQLFKFVEYCEQWSAGRGWGRAHKNALSRWYHSFDGQELKLARLVTRFPGRSKWHHKGIIRLAHIKPKNNKVGLILRYITHGFEEATEMYCSGLQQTELDPGLAQIAEFLKAVEETKRCNDPATAVRYIHKYKLAQEYLSAGLLNNQDVLYALINNMPLETLMRNLGKIAAVGLLNPGSVSETLVISRLESQEKVRTSKLHPFRVLTLKYRYQKGRGERGEIKWDNNDNIRKALEKTFHLSFCNLVPTGKRLFVTFDGQGMYNQIAGNSTVIARDAAATMIMAAVRTEENPLIFSFCHDIREIEVSKQETISDVADKFSHLYYSATDCARPITYAMENKILVDVFVIYTDIYANYSTISPVEALDKYRKYVGVRDTKLIVVGMSCKKARYQFNIADRTDPFMLDIVGFDTSTPLAIDLFIRGKIL